MKKESIKIFKKTSRKIVPHSFLKGKVMPSRKRKLLEEIFKKDFIEYQKEE